MQRPRFGRKPSILCLFLATMLALTACQKKNDDNDDDQTSVTPTTLPKIQLTGVVANGLAVPNTEVTLVDAAQKSTTFGKTDATGQYTGSLPEGVSFPIRLEVNVNGQTLATIVAQSPASNSTRHVNPVTTVVSTQLSSQTGLTEEQVNAAGNSVMQKVFGAGASFEIFASDPSFTARTAQEGSSKPSVADLLLDTVQESSGSSALAALQSKAQTGGTPLLETPAFQVELSTNLVGSGYDATTAKASVQQAIPQANAANVINTVTEAVIQVKTEADKQGLSNAQLNVALDGVSEAIKQVIATEKTTLATTQVQNLAQNVTALVSTDLVKTVKEQSSTLNTAALSAVVETSAQQAAFVASQLKLTETLSTETLNATKTTVSKQVSDTVNVVAPQVRNAQTTSDLETALNSVASNVQAITQVATSSVVSSTPAESVKPASERPTTAPSVVASVSTTTTTSVPASTTTAIPTTVATPTTTLASTGTTPATTASTTTTTPSSTAAPTTTLAGTTSVSTSTSASPTTTIVVVTSPPTTQVTVTNAPTTTSTPTSTSSTTTSTSTTTTTLPQANINRSIQDEVFYFLLPDRFANGDTSNDRGGLASGDTNEDIAKHGFKPSAKNYYHGGDLKGLMAKLDYLKEMGVTSLWIGPVFKNKTVDGNSAGYHGYWITDFTKVDPHFGTNEDFKTLVETAHAKGMKIFLDIVVNHTADVIRYRECSNDDGSLKTGLSSCVYRPATTNAYTAFIPAGQENIKVPAWLNDPKYYHNRGDTTFSGESSELGDFYGLDDLATENAEVAQKLVDLYTVETPWIKDYKIDGFRIDTVKHVNIEFWQKFAPAVKAYAKQQGVPNFFIFGEVFDFDTQKLSSYTTQGKLDSVLDFGFEGATRAFVTGNSGNSGLKGFFEGRDLYNDADSDVGQLLNFVGSHDEGRLGYFINRDNASDTASEKLARLKLGYAMTFFVRGIPLVYYGDEQGFTGDGSGEDARQSMFASQVSTYNDDVLIGTSKKTNTDNYDTNHPLYQAIKAYASLFKEHRAFRRGTQVQRASSDQAGVYVFSRIDEQDRSEYIVALNNSKATRTATFSTSNPNTSFSAVYPSGGIALKSNSSSQLSVSVPALSFVIYKSGAKVAQNSLSVTLSNVSAGDVLSGLFPVVATVTGSDLANVTFYLQTTGGAYQVIGEDNTAPYRAFLNTGAWSNNTAITLLAKVTDGTSSASSSAVAVRLDNRTPQVTVTYENGNQRTSVYGITASGRILLTQTLGGSASAVTVPWTAGEASVGLFYDALDTSKNLFNTDFPIYLESKQVLRLSKESNGQLIANLFVNDARQIADTNNFTIDGTTKPQTFTRQDDATPPFGTTTVYVRGSMNGWNASQEMTYVGNETYERLIDLNTGDYEFKFADAGWSENMNFGGPVGGTNGLTTGGSSTNLKLTISQAAQYRFTLVNVTAGGTRFTFPRISKDSAPYTRTLYVRGTILPTGWGTNEPSNQLVYRGNNLYELQTLLNPGSYEFKIADTAFSSGTNFGASVGSLTLGQAKTLSDGGGNLSVTIAATGGYLFRVDASSATAPTLTLTALPSPYGKDLYVRGLREVWDANTTNSMIYAGNNLFRYQVTLAPGAHEFKVADAGWTSGTNFGGNTAKDPVTFGQAKTLKDGGENLLVTIAATGSYIFTLNVTNKITPSLTVTPVDNNPYNTDLFVRGSFSNWEAQANFKMAYTGNNIFVLTATLGAGTHQFKVADTGWTSGTNFGGTPDPDPVTLGQAKTLKDGGNNLQLTVAATSTYTFRLDATNKTTPSLLVQSLDVNPYGVDLFVRGAMNDWGATNAFKMTYTSGNVFVLKATLIAGSYQFKVADAGWAASSNIGAENAGETLTLGQAKTLANHGNSQNLTITIPANGTYIFSLNATNKASPSLTVTADVNPYGKDLFVRGSMNSWEAPANAAFTYTGDNILVAKQTLNVGVYEFKVADKDWSGGSNFGGNTAKEPVTLSQAKTLKDGGENLQITISATGLYLFTLNASNKTAPSLTVVQDIQPYDKALYVRGSFNEWAANVGMSYTGNGIYTAIVTLAAGTHEFKIADTGWTGSTNIGGATDKDPVTLGQEKTLTASDGSKNLAITITTAGNYLFSLNATSKTAPKLTVTAYTAGGGSGPTVDLGPYNQAVYLRGTVVANGFGTTNKDNQLPYLSTDKKFVLYVNIPAGNYKFKLATGDWSAANFGGTTENEAIQLGTAKTLKGGGDSKDLVLDVAEAGIYEMIFDVANTLTPSVTVKKAAVMIVHYVRKNADYSGWGLHLWNPDAEKAIEASEETQWASPKTFDAEDEFGRYAVVKLKDPTKRFGLIVHKGDDKDTADDRYITASTTGTEIWLVQGNGSVFTSRAAALAAANQVGDLKRAQARWLTRDTIAWKLTDATTLNSYRLHSAANGGMSVGTAVSGADASYVLTLEGFITTQDPLYAQYPYLKDYAKLKLDTVAQAQVAQLLKTQLAVSLASTQKLLDVTAVQTAGVLDATMAYTGNDLGVSFKGTNITLKVWAPTAKSVKALFFESSSPSTNASLTRAMTEGASGVWTLTVDDSWNDKYYLYEVEVFVRSTGAIEKNRVTDPYSVSLAANSIRSHILNLSESRWKPSGWDQLAKPNNFTAPEDISIYELHVRDFSIYDNSVTPDYRGRFMAFTESNSNGMKHLKALAEAGLTHLHLLPAFDIATIEENISQRKEPDAVAMAAAGPASEVQQAAVAAVADQDGFNWGYDPYHYGAPEGSYATNPNGGTRVLEFRKMVQALNQTGLNVVMDVVYNHTAAAGQNNKSVLDKIVPGYYYRLDNNGGIQSTTCCPDTAAENFMMEKLMVDTLLIWAKAYKVDSFRFDLGGHHPAATMTRIRDTLHALTVEKDGVDGKRIYVYGEAWKFGSLDNILGDRAFNQGNSAGLGMGTFSDRLRDAARGGSAFGSLEEQGFLTGMFFDNNANSAALTQDVQKARLINQVELISLGMAGNLKDYVIYTDSAGKAIRGSDIKYGGNPGAGYTADPQELISYISKHDGHSTWDMVMAKVPNAVTVTDRMRIANMGMSLMAVGQGIPFFHAGEDLLRSKSGDRNSYNSGDWFNRLDFTYENNNWGVGMPPTNEGTWETIWRPLLSANDLKKPTKNEIMNSVQHFREMLQIRKSSPLFHLRTAQDIQNRVRFPNLERNANQIPGLIVMVISDQIAGEADLDPNAQMVVSVFNPTKEAITFTDEMFKGLNLQLHPVLQNSWDSIVKQSTFVKATGALTIPARTSAIFYEPQE